MKLHIKTVLLIIVTLLLLFFLSGCLPGLFPPPTPKGVISGRVMVPGSEAAKDITGWVPAANATVTLTDSEGVTHTVTTDKDGYYSFGNVAVGTDTIITATATIDGNTVVMKDVVPQAVAAIEDYDAGTMTPESTALGLIVEKLTEQGLTSEDINLEEIQASDNFTEVVEQVSSVLEENGNVTTDPDVTEVVNDTAEEIINPPAVTSVTVTPATATVVQGGTQQLTATVVVVSGAAQTVTWTSSDVKVTVNTAGLVTVAADAPTADYTITATSTFDTTKSGTSTITVTLAPPVTRTVTNTVTLDYTEGGPVSANCSTTVTY